MKNLLMLLALMGIAGIIGSGCSTTARRTTATSYSSGFSVDVVSPKLEAEVEVGDPVTGNGEITFIFGTFPVGDYVSMYDTLMGWMFRWQERMVRDTAEYAAFKNSNADFLVAPKYDVEERSYFLWVDYSATVTGFAGKYKGFKPISLDKQKELGMLDNQSSIVNVDGVGNKVGVIRRK